MKFNEFNITELLGYGGYGSVYLGENYKTKNKYALKLIPKPKQNEILKNQHILNEINNLKKLNHKYITKIKGVFDNINFEKKKYICIVQDYYKNRELMEYLLYTDRFSENITQYYFKQLLEAVEYMHINNIIHRDLKPENLMLSDDFNLKIIDFGLSKDTGIEKLKTKCGTTYYIGPEIYNGNSYDNMCDIWSCGVILFVMIIGHPPFGYTYKGDWWFDRLNEGRRNLFWDAHSQTIKISKEIKDLLDKLLVIDPKKRINMYELKNENWINKKNNIDNTIIKNILSQKKITVEKKLLEQKKLEQKKLLEKKFDPFLKSIYRNISKSENINNYSIINENITNIKLNKDINKTDSYFFNLKLYYDNVIKINKNIYHINHNNVLIEIKNNKIKRLSGCIFNYKKIYKKLYFNLLNKIN